VNKYRAVKSAQWTDRWEIQKRHWLLGWRFESYAFGARYQMLAILNEYENPSVIYADLAAMAREGKSG
jgi:hypothetical protein